MNVKTLKVRTQKIIQYDEKTNEQTEKYINLGYVPNKEVSLEKLGYHFTPRKNFASIQATGVRPQIGSNSSGGLGREALDKTFFSNGKNGVMQLFNRLVGASCELPITEFQRDKEKEIYLLEYQKQDNIVLGGKQLTVLEGFEFARRYMEDCCYFAFEPIEPQYSKVIDEEKVDEQIANVNSNIDNLSGITVEDRLYDEEKLLLIQKTEDEIKKLKLEIQEGNNVEKNTKKISVLINSQNFLKKSTFGENVDIAKPKTTIMYIDKLMGLFSKNDPAKEVIGSKLSQMRSQITIQIREKSKPQIDEFRGKIISSDKANYERIDYNEDMVAWVDVEKYPHNAHTMITEENGEKKGVVIDGDSLSMLSLKGEKPATAIELTQYIFERASEEEKKKFAMNMPGRKTDMLIMEDFYDYVNLYNQYKDNPNRFAEQIREFEKRLNSKYSNSKQHNPQEMSEKRMKDFVNEVTRDINLGEK